MNAFHWLESQADSFLNAVTEWASVNSGSWNAQGLNQVADRISELFQTLAPEKIDRQTMSLDSGQPGPLLVFKKRSHLPNQVFLFGHFDTVYGPEHPFQKVKVLEGNRLHGPGVCDMKGGLAILFHGLQAFERFAQGSGYRGYKLHQGRVSVVPIHGQLPPHRRR